ncbi:hypothetical protein [Desulfamplus magnetovallimortis]|nr:hypothetical protein [Desulfamplus magnetovallimortis]
MADDQPSPTMEIVSISTVNDHGGIQQPPNMEICIHFHGKRSWPAFSHL